jgi:hypothetical protein
MKQNALWQWKKAASLVDKKPAAPKSPLFLPQTYRVYK